MDIENLNCYDICDYIRENDMGEVDMLKIIKKYTENYDIDLLKRLSYDIEFYLFQEKEEYETNFTPEDVFNAIEEREKRGVKVPYIYPTPYEKLTEKGKAHRDKMKAKGYNFDPIVDKEALLFPYEFYNVYMFKKLVVEKIKELRPELKNSNYQAFSVMLPEKYRQKLEPALVVSEEPQPENPKQSKTILINGRTPNLLERYLIADKTLNLEKSLYALNVQEKERYKLLALVLGCNEDNARRVMSGTYPAKTNQKEMDDFTNKYLSE
ncbi:hypothetical protein [Capnocytophaga canis]|uniref:hypothetical protein n=1 Tax=Capnocytophaga canis TaxID=1848903 RepID=UPI0015622A6D|nr:hypothetical protein [Capnocytophaga canis]